MEKNTESGRVHAGYIITDSIHIGDTEFVLGRSAGEYPMFVTWQYANGAYYWGHYFSELLEAKRDLLDRAGAELERLRRYSTPREENAQSE